MCFKAKKNTQSLDIDFWFFPHTLTALFGGSLREQPGAQELCWAGAAGGGLKGEGCSLLHIKAGGPETEHGNMLGG